MEAHQRRRKASGGRGGHKKNHRHGYRIIGTRVGEACIENVTVCSITTFETLHIFRLRAMSFQPH